MALPLALAFGVSGVGSASAGLITAIIAGVFIGALSGRKEASSFSELKAWKNILLA